MRGGKGQLFYIHMKYMKAKIARIKQARSLRSRPTAAERIMWRQLRNRRLLGLKFRRQHVIGGYIVDFYCEEIGLVMEIDGGVHGYSDKKVRDGAKEGFLRSRNFAVVRYTNEEVRDNLQGVMDDLYLRCEELQRGR